MVTATTSLRLDPRKPINFGSREFAEQKYAAYRWMLEQAPICRGRVTVVKFHVLSRYDDCVELLRDKRFVRNRSTARGKGGRFPIPLPKALSHFASSMIVEDDPGHRRLRGLVNKAFTLRALERLTGRIESLTHELLDQAGRGEVDLIRVYSLPIPVTVISELVGVSKQDVPQIQHSLRVLTEGLSGWSLLRTFLRDLPAASRFIAELVRRKREDPQDDILSALILAEEDGDRLTEDEIVSMVFLLMVAGYETTVHLITNGVLTLLQHPDQLERLRAEPALMDSAVEEILRHRGPVHGTKMNYATEDVSFHGVTVRKGSAVVPALAAANHDPDAFEEPEVFDVARTKNHHLAFGFGAHFCLGSQLARLETRIALATLLDRCPDLRLAVPQDQLVLQNMPFWHRYDRLPVALE